MSYATVPVPDEETWNKTLFSLGEPHFLQSWQWGELKGVHGWRVHRNTVMRDKQTIGAFLLLTKPILSPLKLIIGYCPRGPMVGHARHLPDVLAALESTAARQGCFYVKADPDMYENSEMSPEWRKSAMAAGWRYSPEQIQPRATGMTDLLPKDSEGEAKLLAGMTKQWRYNVKLGPKRGVKTIAVKGNDFKQFYEVFRETSKRQGFSLRGLGYYQEVADLFSKGVKTSAQLFLATHDKERKPLAGAFLLSYGQRWWYFYGASSQLRRADMPTYTLQWKTQRWARDHGGKMYDWWGAPEKPDDKKDSRYSVWHFKKGFGPRHIVSVGAWDKPIRPLLYYPYMAAAVIRQRFAKRTASRLQR